MPHGRSWRVLTAGTLLALAISMSPAAWAGGSPENVLLIIDPSNRDSLYVGNYYKAARRIPDRNVLYIEPLAANYAAFVSTNLDALFGALANQSIDDHIDYIVTTPGSPFYIAASGYVTDPCWPVNRFSTSGAYTTAFIASEVLGGVVSQLANHYSAYWTDEARAFDGSVKWYWGAPSNDPAARQYFIGALLGYSGARGNTLAQTITMIDRSVAADGTRPGGTFYFMRTTDEARSRPRDGYYPAAVTSIVGLGGQAQLLDAVLPNGRHDCLGIMTGIAVVDIPAANLTILPGAFGDHLTSYAATFDTASQTKVSAWITNGASGSWGTVEEPCNYPGKFPHARMHVYYYQGLSLGEAVFRSVAYVPFQGLLYGDPLTRPFAHLPVVAVNDAPAGPVSGVITLTPTATTTHPTAVIASFDLLVDGMLHSSVAPGQRFSLDTRQLGDGWHDVRVLGYDNTLVKSVGRWIGTLTTDNRGRSAALSVQPVSGNWSTPFAFTVAATGDPVREVRVLQNDRVIAAAPGPSAVLTVHGLKLGAGPVQVLAEALFADGRSARSAPALLTVSYAAGTPAGQAPVAFGYHKHLRPDQPCVVELPATFDDPNVPLTYQIVQAPAQASVVAGSGPYRLVRPAAGAKGIDRLTFRVSAGAANSQTATVVLDFGVLPGDLDCNGLVDFNDITPFVQILSDPAGWQVAHPNCPWENGDTDGNELVDFNDINPFVALLAG